MSIYVLTHERGEYSDWGMSVEGVFSTLKRAQSAVPDATWTAITNPGAQPSESWEWRHHTTEHPPAPYTCWQCQEAWTITRFDLNAWPPA